MNFKKKYLTQLAHYFSGNLLLHAFGFISFPILTKILSINEYGILGLVTNTIWITVAFVKLGLQHSIIRFYEDSSSKAKEDILPVYYSTFIFSAIVLGLLGSLCYLCFIQGVLTKLFNKQITNLLSFTSILILTGCISAFLTTLLRAEQKSKLYNLIAVANKVCSFGLGIYIFIYLLKGLYGYFIGSILTTFVITVFLIINAIRTQNLRWKFVSFKFLRKTIKYGLPLCILEMSHSLLNFGDRYIILYYLDSKELGIYSAGYTLCMQIINVIEYPILLVVPVLYFEMWTNKGRESVQSFLRNSFNYFALIAFPIIFGVIAVSDELLVIIASEKYVSSAQIIPFVITGGIIFASSTFFSAGLYIEKKSIFPGIVMLITALINLFLNVLLVPKHGIVGAAIATLIGYTSYVFVIIPISFKYLSFKLNYALLIRYLFYSIIMFIIIQNLSFYHDLSSLLVKICIGIIVYSGLVITFEKHIRKKIIDVIYKSQIAGKFKVKSL